MIVAMFPGQGAQVVGMGEAGFWSRVLAAKLFRCEG